MDFLEDGDGINCHYLCYMCHGGPLAAEFSWTEPRPFGRFVDVSAGHASNRAGFVLTAGFWAKLAGGRGAFGSGNKPCVLMAGSGHGGHNRVLSAHVSDIAGGLYANRYKSARYRAHLRILRMAHPLADNDPLVLGQCGSGHHTEFHAGLGGIWSYPNDCGQYPRSDANDASCGLFLRGEWANRAGPGPLSHHHGRIGVRSGADRLSKPATASLEGLLPKQWELLRSPWATWSACFAGENACDVLAGVPVRPLYISVWWKYRHGPAFPGWP